MSYWSLVGAGVGAVAGVVAGIYCPPAWGVTIPAGIAAGSALGGAAGGAVDSSNAADESEAKQKQAAENQSKINENVARRQARGAYEAAMNNPSATSDSMFTKATLQREANANYASVRDKGNPFTESRDKSDKTPVAPQFYGNRAA